MKRTEKSSGKHRLLFPSVFMYRLATIIGILIFAESVSTSSGRSAIISQIIEPEAQRKSSRTREFLSRLTEDDILEPPQENVYRTRFTPTKTWKDGLVPVTIEDAISQNPVKVESLLSAMKVFAKYTCIRFITRTDQEDYIRIVDGGEGRCYSFVGRVGGEQILSVGSGCEVQVGIIVHEMNHALGFLHEHSRPDRDQFITVDYAAIKDGYDRNFEKYGLAVADTLDLPYDYGSIMHYHAYAFSKDGRMTIIPKDFAAKDVMGQREGFSACDIAKINKLYQCKLPNAPKCETESQEEETTSPPATTSIPSESTAPPIFPKPEDSCRDAHPFCSRLQNQPDLCIREPGIYMLQCKKSCGNCDGFICMDGQGFPASNICGLYTPKHCGYSNVDAWCPASCGLCG